MANVKFEFSDMNHPVAGDTSGSEVWTTAQGFFKATIHWELGHTPDWIDCYFHAAESRQFPWTRVRATDENGAIGIWRFDHIEEQFEGGSRQWRAVGRCALYGVVDNYLRSPRIKAEEDPDNDDDPGYTEWPIIPPSSLTTLEDLEDRAKDVRTVGCARIQDVTGCGSAADPCTLEDALGTTIVEGGSQFFKSLPCVFDRNSDRDTFLVNNFSESRYNQEPSKLGPNYMSKGVRRGWVFKDIMRHSSGSFDSASRPILAVYNRSLGSEPITNEGSVIRSNFQQSQSPGAGANALAYDVAISWPWIGSSTGDSGYDYRTVWPGKTDTYAPSGQAVELKQRGQFAWDDDQCWGNEPGTTTEGKITRIDVSANYRYVSNDPLCPDDFFESSQASYTGLFTETPTPPELCALVPGRKAGRDLDHSTCTFDFTATLVQITVDVYFGTLSGTCCPNPFSCVEGQPDFFEAIGGGPNNCGASCGSPYTQFFWYVPSSSCPDFDFIIPACSDDDTVFSNPNIQKIPLITETTAPPCGNPIIGFEVSVNAKNIYSHARAFGMGVNNAGGQFTARLPGSETTWNPSQNQFKVRREIILNDYGINEGLELLNLSQAYLTLPGKEFGGFTTLKMWVAGIPRAGSAAPHPNRIIQAADRLQIGAGLPKVEAGAWIVDSAEYEFPKGILTLLLSQRPAAQTRPLVRGNIRSIGESLATVGGVYESPWFSVDDEEFSIAPGLADPSKFYDTFQFQHYLGVPPRTITMIAAKQKIFDWHDSAVVEAAQPLYVPRSFIDLSQVQGVGYDVFSSDETRIVFHFWRYLFYDDLDGAWIRPQDRFIKVWILP